MRSTPSSLRSHRIRIIPLVIWTILTLAWMTFMFMMSNQPYQEQDIKPMLSGWIAEPSLAALTPMIEFTYGGQMVSGQQPYDFWEFFIRKGGHVAEFALLTFLLIRVLSECSRFRYMPLLWSGLAAYVFAASDEWHQTFIAGRTGHFADTLIDAIGIAVMIIIYAWIRYRSSQKQGLHFS